MIAKVTKGRKAGGALRYDFSPGHREEHKDPRIVAGSVPGTPQQVARIIDRHTRQRADVARPIWRCSLSLPDEDGELTDEKWQQIAEEYVGRMWGHDVPWVAVRHGADHIHLTVSRVRWSGELASDSHDYARSRPIVRALEREHGLIDAESRSDRVAPQVSGPERAAAQRRGAERPEREQLRDLIRAARDASAGGGRLAFEQALAAAGVDYRANTARNGRMSGYSFSLPGWQDSGGEQVWAAASKVSRDLSWAKLDAVLGRPDPRIAYALPPQPRQEQGPTAERSSPPVTPEELQFLRGVAASAARARSTTVPRRKVRLQSPDWSAGLPPQQLPPQGPERGSGLGR
ncbi:relaxase/mobilization nuclease domain-containing protein [Streptomyces sp. NPDC012794]|uniref:relaxase/mobilization nuclease domain-containing protein n=1 Tax=Streptomyces sp. NPDC012794 TaxID=3364850 RepID=UPI0036865022